MGKGMILRRGGGGLAGDFDATSGWYPYEVSSLSNLTYTLNSKYQFAMVFTTGATSNARGLPDARIILVDFAKQTTRVVTAGNWTAPVVSVSGHTITIAPNDSYCYAAVIGIG